MSGRRCAWDDQPIDETVGGLRFYERFENGMTLEHWFCSYDHAALWGAHPEHRVIRLPARKSHTRRLVERALRRLGWNVW
jgi:hypothetical protein